MRFIIFKFLPKKLFSRLAGLLINLKLPWPLSTISVQIYTRIFNVDLSSASKPITDYACIGELFTRELKLGVRPLGQGLVSPLDGTLRGIRTFSNYSLEQIKGINYSIKSLLLEENFIKPFESGISLSFYLSPRDYHHVHAPFDMELLAYSHIGGTLWPVNDWALQNVAQLYCLNERVVFHFNSAKGLIVLVMVGAFNVGSIVCKYVERRSGTCYLQNPIFLKKGERLAHFAFGSSVIMLVEQGKFDLNDNSQPLKIVYGQSLERIKNQLSS